MNCSLLASEIFHFLAPSGGVLLLLWGFWKIYLRPYLDKKGENLATKEDVAGITDKIEQVKAEYAKDFEDIRQQNRFLLEHAQYKNQLRLAALDRRLQAHQEAYALWQNLMDNAHDREKVGDAVATCQEWWRENSLYLDAEARKAFITAFKSAPTYCQIWTELREADAGEMEMRESVLTESWESVSSAGKVIVKAVELPSLAEEEPNPADPSEGREG